MLIAAAVREELDEVCVRIDAVQYIPATRRLVDTDRDLQELVEYLEEPADVLAPIADRRFIPVKGKYLDGRYNSIDFPAFYVSRNTESARAEILHYHPIEKLRKFADVHRPLHFGITEWDIAGAAENLLPATSTEPRLTADDPAFCRDVGSDARTRVDAVVYPSARLSGGENIAVFRRHRASGKGRGADLRLDVTELGTVAFLD